MRFQNTSLIVLLALFVGTGLAVPFADPDAESSPTLDGPKLESREPHAQPESRDNPPTPPKPAGGCPSQKPIAQNLCTSGSPYCCSGSGSAQVCGPASSVSCSATTICCINTNGMQICAGEIDFTGPVTININL